MNTSRINFYFTMVVVNFIFIGLGNTYSWTGPTLPYLMSADSILPIDQSVGSWIASLYLVGAAISPFFASSVTHAIGFKRTFIMLNICVLISWGLLASAWSVPILYVGRFLAGVTVGMMYLTAPMYVAEISEDSLRGAMNSTLVVSRCFGALMQYSIGPLVSYRLLILINSIGPVFYLLCSLKTPESPYHLLEKGKKEAALKTVIWLRGGISLSSAETITGKMQTFIDQTKSDKKSLKDLFVTRGNVKALLISGILLALQQLTGMTVMLFYTKQLFQMTGSDISADTSSSIYGALYLLGSLFGPFFAKKFGFRKPLIVSGIILGAAQFVLALYMYFYISGFDVSNISWLPVACALVYAGAFNCAMGPMPWAVMGEIFPANIKVQAGGLAITIAFATGFLTTKFFPILSDILHIYTVFWFFAFSSFMVSIFTAVSVPNTKGLSLEEIQNILNK